MGVVTQNELDVVRKTKTSKKAKGKKKNVEEVQDIKAIEEPISNQDYLFVLVHPENEVDNLKNFEDTVLIGDKNYKRKCVNGAVKTKDEPLAKYLMSQGYPLIDKIKQGEIKR